MRQLFRSFLILALPLSILAACGTDRESTSPVDVTLELAGVADDCPTGEISMDIAQIFPAKKNLAHKATITCGQIFRDFGKGKQSKAIERAFAFFQKTLGQNEAGQLLDPDPSVEAKIVELFAAIFAGIGFDIPEIDPQVLMEGEYAIGELVPGGPPLLTLSKHAGIDDNGGLFGPVSVFIVKIGPGGGGLEPSSLSHPCPAGVDDSFDCYPLFFDYTVTPVSNVNPAVGLQVGQCNVSPSEVEVELLTPEGFLPEIAAPTGLDCSDVQPEAVAMTGWRGVAWTVLEPISPLFRVTPAFAGRNPLGGSISSFSPVAPADPNSGDGGGGGDGDGGGGGEPPPPGTDIVVFNDINVFDDGAMTDPNNVLLVQNLVGFTTGKLRDAGDEVWIDCRTSVSGGLHGCDDQSTFQSTIENQGLSLIEVFEGSLDDLPPEVKVLILWLPTTAYTTAEINAFKQFAGEGGRIVFVGEHAGVYGPYIADQNAFLEALGAVLRNSGGQFDCGYVGLPGSSLREHQITDGLSGLTIACSSEIVLGPNDFPLYVDTTEAHVLSGVATIDTTPIAEQGIQQSRSVRLQAVPAPTVDPVGRPIRGSR